VITLQQGESKATSSRRLVIYSRANIFDALRPVENAASITMQEILKPTRASRLAEAAAYDPEAPGLKEVLTAVIAYTWKREQKKGNIGASQRAIARIVVQSILAATTREGSTAAVRGACWFVLDDLQNWMHAQPPAADWQETYSFVSHAIASPEKFAPSPSPSPPLDPMGFIDRF